MERDIQPADTYLKKLNTLLPAEVTGLYLFIRSLTQQNLDLYPYLGIAVVIIAILLYVFGEQILHISKPVTRILYCVTFLLWVASIEVYILSDWLAFPALAFIIPAVVAIWTFAVPSVFDSLGG